MTVLTHFLLWNLGLSKAWTCYTENECTALEKYASGKKRLAEIGCWQGVNTARLRKVMSPEGALFAVDPYPEGRLGFNAAEKIAHREVGKIKNASIRWMKMTDLEAAEIFAKEKQLPLDFIFSDSLNTYEGALNTWNAWQPLLNARGIYIIANSHPTPEKPIEKAGIVRFVKDRVLTDPRFELLEITGCFTILKKKVLPVS